jgi:hypothetical protein
VVVGVAHKSMVSAKAPARAVVLLRVCCIVWIWACGSCPPHRQIDPVMLLCLAASVHREGTAWCCMCGGGVLHLLASRVHCIAVGAQCYPAWHAGNVGVRGSSQCVQLAFRTWQLLVEFLM